MSRPGAPSKRLAGCVALTATALALAGCGSDNSPSNNAGKPELKITGAYMPAPVMDTMAAGFFTVTNSGGADTLTSVTSDLAPDVTLHSTKGGAMEEQKSFAVPADGSLDFASGGNHLMFENLAHKPLEGEKVSVTLHFTKAGAVKVSMPVKSATYNPKTGH
ncbi:copper chaperone PCu(A)C [Streptomyces mirabilis]|uniref:copper chaperone PCu(A)C n=1 Tax=Streptomyces mirabilis TaxID=68239 RepID=UPI003681C5FA